MIGRASKTLALRAPLVRVRASRPFLVTINADLFSGFHTDEIRADWIRPSDVPAPNRTL